METSEKWWSKNDIRVIYTFDKDTCISCLCPDCGSSIKRKFLLRLFPMKKVEGCINHKCKNYFYTKNK